MTFQVFLRCSLGLALSIGLFAQGGGRGSGIGTLPGNPTNQDSVPKNSHTSISSK